MDRTLLLEQLPHAAVLTENERAALAEWYVAWEQRTKAAERLADEFRRQHNGLPQDAPRGQDDG